jgi:hypothetical protein
MFAKVHVGAEQFHEVYLLRFLRCFPQDFFSGNLCEDFLHKAFAHLSAAAVDTDVTSLSCFSNHVRRTGLHSARISSIHL